MSLLPLFGRRKTATVIPLQPQGGKHEHPLDDRCPELGDRSPALHLLVEETADWEREKAEWDRDIAAPLAIAPPRPFHCSAIGCGEPVTWIDPTRPPGATPIRKCAAHEPRACHLSVVDGGQS